MQKIIFNKLRTVIILLTVLGAFSCSEEDVDLGNLSDTIMVRHKNADMPAYIHGNGSEKVFMIILHGGPGGSGLLGWRATTIKSEIEKSCAVVYFDQRGSGVSQGSYSDDEISIDIMAEDVLALVKVIKHKYGSDSRFFLMGASWGGALGTATLLKDQNEFLGWIEIAGAHNAKGLYFEYITNYERVASEQIDLGNSIDYWEGVKDLVQEVDATQYSHEDFFKLNGQAHISEERLMKDQVIAQPSLESDIGNILKTNLMIRSWNNGNIDSQLVIEQGFFKNLSYTDRLSEITIPSLVLWGKHDMIVPPAFAQEAYDHLGSTVKELVIFENSGHSPMESEADLFAEAVITFIDQNK